MALNTNRANRIVGGLALVIIAIIAAACGSAVEGPSSEPPTPAVSGAPRVYLIYEGAVYLQHGVSDQEAAKLADDLELVGSTSESNKLAPGQNLDLYRPAGAQTSDVYTLLEGQTFLNEDGRTVAIQPEWARWTVSVDGLPSNGPEPVGQAKLAPGSVDQPVTLATHEE